MVVADVEARAKKFDPISMCSILREVYSVWMGTLKQSRIAIALLHTEGRL